MALSKLNSPCARLVRLELPRLSLTCFMFFGQCWCLFWRVPESQPMSKAKPGRGQEKPARKRRRFTEEFKAEAVQMLLDGHAAGSICERLGLSSLNLLYRWKREAIARGAAVGLEGRVRELEAELRRVERERDILKKASHFRPRRMRDVYAGIDQLVLMESFAASAVCRALEVSRSGFYAWRSGEESGREAMDRQLAPEIRDIFWRHRRRYGARRIVIELSQRGIASGVGRVARLLKNQGLRAIQPKSISRTRPTAGTIWATTKTS